jgi:carboxylate-amine ligase
VPTELLRAASWQAARHGITGDLMDLRGATRGGRVLRPAEEVLHGLVDAVRPALRAAGDLDQALRGVSAALATGGGAGRQRAVLAAGGLPALLGLMQESSAAA